MGEVFAHYAEIMSDPAHLMAEVSLMVIVDVLFLGLLWPLITKTINARFDAEHKALDAEHGVDHTKATARAGAHRR